MLDSKIDRVNERDPAYISRQRHKAVTKRNYYRKQASNGDTSGSLFSKMLAVEKEIIHWDNLMRKAKCSS